MKNLILDDDGKLPALLDAATAWELLNLGPLRCGKCGETFEIQVNPCRQCVAEAIQSPTTTKPSSSEFTTDTEPQEPHG
jgi:hypothetical protein